MFVNVCIMCKCVHVGVLLLYAGANRTVAAIYEKKLRGFKGTWCSLADCAS